MAGPVRRAGPLVAMAGAIVVVAAAFLPWARSGAARRSSFELVRTAERLDLLDGVLAGAAPAWYLLPLVVSLAWLAAAVGRAGVAAALCAAAGAAAVGLAVAVKMSPLGADVGTSVSAVAGLVAVAGAGLTVWEQRRRG